MTDRLDGLKSALADRYSIECDLAAGWMYDGSSRRSAVCRSSD